MKNETIPTPKPSPLALRIIKKMHPQGPPHVSYYYSTKTENDAAILDTQTWMARALDEAAPELAPVPALVAALEAICKSFYGQSTGYYHVDPLFQCKQPKPRSPPRREGSHERACLL